MNYFAKKIAKYLISNIEDGCSFVSVLAGRLARKNLVLIIGDSHAVVMGGGVISSLRRVQVAPEISNAYVIWLGPKLLYTVVNKGFPFWVRLLMSKKICDFFGASKVRLDLVIGEIDIRCHLAFRLKMGGRVTIERLGSDFVEMLLKITKDLGVSEIRYFEPTPPSDFGIDNASFPRNGALSERIECHKILSNQIAAEVSNYNITNNEVKFVPNPVDSKLENGSLNPAYTNDGCHFNHSTWISLDPVC